MTRIKILLIIFLLNGGMSMAQKKKTTTPDNLSAEVKAAQKDSLKSSLSEWQNIAYGRVKKESIGSSVSSISGKDVEKNTILLGNKDTIKKSSLIAREMNYISISEPSGIFKALAKVRYSSRETEVNVTPLPNGRALVEFLEPQAFIAPGQAVVLYNGNIVIGGGIIEKEPQK